MQGRQEKRERYSRYYFNIRLINCSTQAGIKVLLDTQNAVQRKTVLVPYPAAGKISVTDTTKVHSRLVQKYFRCIYKAGAYKRNREFLVHRAFKVSDSHSDTPV